MNTFVLLLFIGASYQACCEACISKLTIDGDWQLSDEWSLPNVTTYTIASTSSIDVDVDGFCGNVFKEYGSCCNQTELYERACAWNARLKSRMSRVIKGLDLMSNYTSEIGKFITAIETNSESITSGEGGTTSTDPPRRPFEPEVALTIVSAGKPTEGTNMCGSSLSFTNLPIANVGQGMTKDDLTNPTSITPWTDRLGYIRDDSSTDREARETYATENYADCCKALSNLRTNALCMRCSGAASFYYSSSGYSVSESTCSHILEKCAVVFAAVSEANALYTTLANLKQSLGGSISVHAYGKVATNEELEEWGNCADDIDTCISDQYQANKLCSQVSLSEGNQALEGNVNTFAEGKGVADAIIAGNTADSAEADYDYFSSRRIRVLQTDGASTDASSGVVVTDEDDGYGYMLPSSRGPDLVNYFAYTNHRE